MDSALNSVKFLDSAHAVLLFFFEFGKPKVTVHKAKGHST